MTFYFDTLSSDGILEVDCSMNFDHTILSFTDNSAVSYYSQKGLILNDVSHNLTIDVSNGISFNDTKNRYSINWDNLMSLKALNVSNSSTLNVNNTIQIQNGTDSSSIIISIENNNAQLSINSTKGQSGQVLTSGGNSSSMYWGSGAKLQDVVTLDPSLYSIDPLINQVITYDGTKTIWQTPTLNTILTNNATSNIGIQISDASYTNIINVSHTKISDISGNLTLTPNGIEFNSTNNKISINNNNGLNGQVIGLNSTSGELEWVNIISSIPTLDQVIIAGNSTSNIVNFSNITSDDASFTTLNVSGQSNMSSLLLTNLIGKNMSFNNLYGSFIKISNIGNTTEIPTINGLKESWSSFPKVGQIIPTDLYGTVNFSYGLVNPPIIILTTDCGTSNFIIPISLGEVTNTSFNWMLSSFIGVLYINYIIYSKG